MHRSAILLLLVLTGSVCRAQQFNIHGHIPGLPDQWVMLTYMDDSLHHHMDSAYATGGTFRFDGAVNEPTAGGLFTADGKINTTFFFEPGITSIAVDSLSLRVNGGSSTSEYHQFQMQKTSLEQQADSIRSAAYADHSHSNDSDIDLYWNKYTSAIQAKEKELDDWVLAHPNSAVSAYYFLTHYMAADDLVKGDSLLGLLSPKVQHSKYRRLRNSLVQGAVLREVGQPVKHFTMADTSGKLISTTQFKGRYLLIDFWASWCKPCRDENPNLVYAYRTYHDKGFDIISVSLDNVKENWKQAILKDGLSWTNVSDLSLQNAAAALYDVHSLPANFLVDTNGMIIGKLLRGKQLLAKLEELF